ncbi:Stk1 family PASTA domain-containing Ser/Thr kinase [Propionicicella superfundia]|uniref:Stk1 family PASTA domain-containing Ser/Thr kinase n=1 Tax=Propionicicella superfundia TaxID=348582 RepID=UPI0003F93C26|nr:Stk1 family PASTA domain-containing Ser/Thr kinase [Propionicicella superfundia]
MTDEPRRLGGRYELGDLLGRGGMAEVRRARDVRLGRDVAVKLLRVDLATDSTFQARFRKEAQAAAGLNHPNIVAVYDTGEEADPATGVMVPYIVMELVVGHTLRDILRDGRRIVPERALEMTQGVLDALAYSHKSGIIHRDIKPANVMLTRTGVVKVMDFGIARAVSDTSSTMTATAAVIGTAQYLSPEQARGEIVDNRSDVYSTGCLLYELLTGRPPFSGDSPVSVAYQHVRETPVPPSQLDSLVTPEMDAITMKALAKDPIDRYQTATEMRGDIAAAIAGRPLMAPAVASQPNPEDYAETSLLPAGGADETALRTGPARAVDEAENGKKKKMKGSTVALLVLSGLVAVALIAVGVFLLVPTAPKTTAVPSVLTFNQAAAEKAIADAELQVKVETTAGPDDSSVNTVTRQDPAANTEVTLGSTVTITINVGPSKLTVPSGLAGKDADEVVQQLKTAGFTDVSKKEDTSEDVSAKANQVTRVNPAEGATVTPDTAVVVYYATGKSSVPNLYGLTQDKAKEMAEQAGFDVTFETKEDATATEGTVVSQIPDAGSVEERTRIITAYLAKRPPEPTTPTTPPTTTPQTTPPTTTPPSPSATES